MTNLELNINDLFSFQNNLLLGNVLVINLIRLLLFEDIELLLELSRITYFILSPNSDIK